MGSGRVLLFSMIMLENVSKLKISSFSRKEVSTDVVGQIFSWGIAVSVCSAVLRDSLAGCTVCHDQILFKKMSLRVTVVR